MCRSIKSRAMRFICVALHNACGTFFILKITLRQKNTIRKSENGKGMNPCRKHTKRLKIIFFRISDGVGNHPPP